MSKTSSKAKSTKSRTRVSSKNTSKALSSESSDPASSEPRSKSGATGGPVAAVLPGTKIGSKRTCPKCSTKFYDFCKEDLNCPKCNAKLKASQLVSVPNIPRAEPKKIKAPEKVVAEVLSQDEGAPEIATDAFESVEDLGDDDNVVEDLSVEEDDDEKENY